MGWKADAEDTFRMRLPRPMNGRQTRQSAATAVQFRATVRSISPTENPSHAPIFAAPALFTR